MEFNSKQNVCTSRKPVLQDMRRPEDVNPESIVSIILNRRENWNSVEQYNTLKMGAKENEDQHRQMDHHHGQPQYADN